MISVKVIADSISLSGARLTTLELIYPRFIHAELLTHRVFSRNSASSRAIPISKTIEEVMTNPAMPIHWGKNQRGMQAYREIEDVTEAKRIWLEARDFAVNAVRRLETLGIHKQVGNRLLEPFIHMCAVVSSTTWDNFLLLRDHEAAQPEMQVLAREIRHALNSSHPTLRLKGEWHLPYILPQENYLPLEDKKIISAARCARVSYRLRNGKISDPDSDRQLFDRLAGASPKHLSPLEHVAECMDDKERYANFTGWRQLRYHYEI
ncbi:MAG: FAD-dependent thymidylate synthase [Candidatus Gracilibacteria bacterium]